MKTVFSTGPGFYAAATRSTDNLVPPGLMRFWCARLEAYDGPLVPDADLAKLEFKLLVAMSDGKPEVARALLQLHAALSGNLEELKKEAKQT